MDLRRLFGARLAPSAWRSPSSLLAASRGAEVLVTRNLTRLDAALIRRLPDLRCVAVYGTGIDHLDSTALQAARIDIVRGTDENASAVAEFTVGLILTLLRRISQARDAVRAGGWPRDELVGDDLSRRRVLVIGPGRVGGRVASLLRAFGAEVMTNRRTSTAGRRVSGARPVSLAEGLALADVVTLHARAQPGAPPILGRAELALLRPGAMVINTARGALVDQAALLMALRGGRLAGAALDVLVQEPPPVPLRPHPRLLITPHIAGFSRRALDALHARVVAALNALLNGPPR